MPDVSRRTFMTLSVKLAAAMSLGIASVPRIAEGLEQLAAQNAPLLWLQAQSCSGCSVSLLNAENPGPARILTGYISLMFHPTLSAATGQVAVDLIERSIAQGGYFLVVEGSLPAGMPEACMMGHESLNRRVARAAAQAKAVVALGTCAAFGGIPAAENNPTGAMSVPAFLTREGINVPTIRLPGCPTHPDWVVGTLVHLLKFGLPALDDQARPKMFFGKSVHEQCPRFADYEKENFARSFSEDGCLFKLGCVGTNTRADCTLRSWNGGVNSCIRAGAPCVGCASEAFPGSMAFAFYRKGEKYIEKESAR